ncbi:VanZ family protein [archaeon]|jgi:VanZ family protein|nr:VanZ family protein [archaeon]MBT4242106.1 VanZ family protein [archaeon]MBT4417794.1 VanZ family protein [archaeon]
MINWLEKHNKVSWTITLIIAITIFIMSSISFKSSSNLFEIKTITYHFLAFFFLCFFLSISLTKGKKTNLIPLSIIFSILYGISDEIHQLFVPNRYFAISDILTDTAGILTSAFIYLILIRSYHNKSKKDKEDYSIVSFY